MAKPRTEQQERRLMDELELSIKVGFGPKCPDHVEECVVCSTYKALNELQRNYGYKETDGK